MSDLTLLLACFALGALVVLAPALTEDARVLLEIAGGR